MSDPDRIKHVLAEVARNCQLYPDMRLGQLLCNIADWANVDLWDMEEEALVAQISRHLQESSRAIAAGKQRTP